MQQKQASIAGHDIIVIGASLGGIDAVASVLGQLPESFPAVILVVIHLHPKSPGMLDRMLAAKIKLGIKFADDGESLRQGMVYLAPPDQHLMVRGGHALLSRGPRENRSRPAIDTLFRSAAAVYATRVIGIVLTGMLDDGTAGLQAIKECGGLAIVQNPEEAEYSEMPEAALKAVAVDHIAKLLEMGVLLTRLVAIPASAPAPIPEHVRREVEVSQGNMRSDMEEDVIGKLIPMACPDCGGSLTELPSGKAMRYRCHEGHAYGQLALVDAQYDKMESALWATARILDEQGNMLMRMHKKGDHSCKHYEARAGEIQAQAQSIRDFLLHIMQKKG